MARKVTKLLQKGLKWVVSKPLCVMIIVFVSSTNQQNPVA